MEHTFTTTAIIDNGKQHGTPLAVTFLDLQNAFGSVAYSLITHILMHIRLPSGLISDGYSKLSTTVNTKEWTTRPPSPPPPFEIKRGMFEGDTLSPVILLTVFNPLVELSNFWIVSQSNSPKLSGPPSSELHLCTLG